MAKHTDVDFSPCRPASPVTICTELHANIVQILYVE